MIFLFLAVIITMGTDGDKQKDKSQWGTIGVSTDLSISYMLAIPAGSKARLECDVQRVGKKLSYIYTKVFDESGRICYSGSHTKFNIDAKL